VLRLPVSPGQLVTAGSCSPGSTSGQARTKHCLLRGFLGHPWDFWVNEDFLLFK
jgi:hypothetical protein